jgi:hypothetical protein
VGPKFSHAVLLSLPHMAVHRPGFQWSGRPGTVNEALPSPENTRLTRLSR